MTEVLIIEDEHLVFQRLARFVRLAFCDRLVLHHADSLETAHELLEEHPIELTFLDLSLHGKDGFKVLDFFLAQPFKTIVVSAYTDRAIEAFEHGVLDFVGKPFTQDRIAKAVERFRLSKGTDTHLQRLAVKMRGDITLVPISDIQFIQASGIYSELHTSNKTYVYDKPLNHLLKLLPNQFMRVHRSFAVNFSLVTDIVRVKHNLYHLQLSTGKTVPVSRQMRQQIRQRLMA
ncbi:LytR/AlgR family response regulator transcription factor [Roseivirga thermotolerans]|uniref:Sensory transduction protein LytT n=1 Tax=Roseivirga thermotolerans TaxID=1758176 RepID=A0ABQ3I994_9BACT|nr:LytTR family DNA-binding domain-containing protein [Roseivirga thermotolerans]GHE73034.1 sensory transduction protein LytT [Roseivirga thermotolerans]